MPTSHPLAAAGAGTSAVLAVLSEFLSARVIVQYELYSLDFLIDEKERRK